MRLAFWRRTGSADGDNTAKRANVLRNSFWYGLEVTLDVVIGTLLSVVVARIIGPERLGQFVYYSFLTNVAGRFAIGGVASAARKYIAEYLARGQAGAARGVFFAALRLQTLIALAILVPGTLLTAYFVTPPLRMVVYLLVAAIVPALLNSIASAANMAAEDFSRNVPSAVLGLATYAAVVVLTLVFHWGLVGLATAILLRRSIEFIVRIVPALRWMRSLPLGGHPSDLHRKLMNFSGQALAITAVLLVVNDRSELLFLKHFCDVRQVAFYSIAFSLAEYLLNLAVVMGGAISSAFMTDFARNPAVAGQRASNALRRFSALVLPAHLGLFAVSAALVRAAYGPAYLPAIPVMALTAVMAIPKAFFWLPSAIYQTAERQATMLRCLAAASVINVALDAILIPRFGAIGAAWANGMAQFLAVAFMWPAAASIGRLKIGWPRIARVAAAALGMAMTVLALCRLLPPKLALILGVAAGVAVYPVFLRLLRVLDQEDTEAFLPPLSRLPRLLQPAAVRLLLLVAGASSFPAAEQRAAIPPSAESGVR